MAQEYPLKANRGLRFVEEWRVVNLSEREGSHSLPKIVARAVNEDEAKRMMQELNIHIQRDYEFAIERVYVVK